MRIVPVPGSRRKTSKPTSGRAWDMLPQGSVFSPEAVAYSSKDGVARISEGVNGKF